jgi:hypothetical protein
VHYIITRKDVSAARENLANAIVLSTPLMGLPFNVNLSIHMVENSFFLSPILPYSLSPLPLCNVFFLIPNVIWI